MNVFKFAIRSFVGEFAWTKLTEFRQEFRVRKIKVHMDPAIYEVVHAHFPKNGFYLDIGAHDGRTSSNTFHLEEFGWGGILIEPIPFKYFKLLSYRGREMNSFVNAACVSPSYKSKTVEMIYCDLMSFIPEISSVDSSSWLEGSLQFMNPLEEQIVLHVPARTVNSILRELSAPQRIDLLSIDVEGSELSVLEGLDLAEFSFGLVIIETEEVQFVKRLFESFDYEQLAYVNGNLILRNLHFPSNS
jgi:FkbM family methyltransferase